MIIHLEVGDHSGDGHMRSEIFQVETHESANTLKEFYCIGAEALDIPDTEYYPGRREYCLRSEDDTISLDEFQRLQRAGLQLNIEDLDTGVEDDKVYLYPEAYARLWMAIASYGHFCSTTMELDYNFVQHQQYVAIGGYGCFY